MLNQEYGDEFIVEGHNSLGPCLRVGFGSRLAQPRAPLGSNPYGYAIGSYCEVTQMEDQQQQQRRCSCSCCCKTCPDTPSSSSSSSSSSRDFGVVRGAPRHRGLFVITRGRRRRLKHSLISFPFEESLDDSLSARKTNLEDSAEETEEGGGTEGLRANDGCFPSSRTKTPREQERTHQTQRTDEQHEDPAAAALDAAAAAATAATAAAAGGRGPCCSCGCVVCGGGSGPHRGDGGRRNLSDLAPPLKEGDIVGCFIHLPGRPPVALEDPRGKQQLWTFLQQGERQRRQREETQEIERQRETDETERGDTRDRETEKGDTRDRETETERQREETQEIERQRERQTERGDIRGKRQRDTRDRDRERHKR